MDVGAEHMCTVFRMVCLRRNDVQSTDRHVHCGALHLRGLNVRSHRHGRRHVRRRHSISCGRAVVMRDVYHQHQQPCTSSSSSSLTYVCVANGNSRFTFFTLASTASALRAMQSAVKTDDRMIEMMCLREKESICKLLHKRETIKWQHQNYAYLS